jgi:Zn finger protein HypA/HybF involved in hydrogenase expression
MHETIIAKEILKEAREKAKGKKIKSITLEVGELAHLPANELKEVLRAIADFKIIVKQVKANVKCECGYEGPPRVLAQHHDFTLFECPECSKQPKILSGTDIVLREIKTA